jgi:hypothetical protein
MVNAKAIAAAIGNVRRAVDGEAAEVRVGRAREVRAAAWGWPRVRVGAGIVTSLCMPGQVVGVVHSAFDR